MATTLTTQTLIDSTSRSVIKVVGVGGGDANAKILVAANLAFALTSNGNNLLTLGDNTNKKYCYRTTIRRVWGQGQLSNTGARVSLNWFGNSNTQIVTFGAGQFDYNFGTDGSIGSIPIPDTANCTGDIAITSTASGTDSWTLFLDLKKDNRDYSAGQHRDPTAFNYGSGHNGA